MSTRTTTDQHRTRSGATPAAGRVRRPSPVEGVEPSGPEASLGAYMRDVSRHPLMTPQQERERAMEIGALRERYWRALLGYAPYVESMAGMLRQELAGDEADPEVDSCCAAAAEAAVAVRERDRKGTRDALDRTVRELAALMSRRDMECMLADRLAADLDQLSLGSRHGVSLSVHPPRRGSRPQRPQPE